MVLRRSDQQKLAKFHAVKTHSRIETATMIAVRFFFDILGGGWYVVDGIMMVEFGEFSLPELRSPCLLVLWRVQ